MSATLSAAREEFIREMYRHNGGAERPRLLAVLDAMIAWSAAHPGLVRFRPDSDSRGVVRFEDVASRAVFWAATPRRDNVPLLQLLPGGSRHLSDTDRADALTRLNARTREANPAGHLCIGFGALKNPASRDAVLELMGELLTKMQPAARAANAPH